MTRMACLALTIALAACGSSDTHLAPTPATFNGTWTGSSSGNTVTVTATQTDSVVSGTGTFVTGGDTLQFTLTGTSKAPAITLTAELPCQSATFAGTYVSADSVTGTLTVDAQPVAFGLKKQ
jgi:hypothetical protein